MLFLFFCPWRVGAVWRLEWRDYSAADAALTLRPALSKTKKAVHIPVDEDNTPALMAILERQRARRRPDCPFIFHGRTCGTPRFDAERARRPCLGDFQKAWDRACIAIGYATQRPDPDNHEKTITDATRIPHDLRRSGVKHYIDAGVDPHTGWLGPGTAPRRCCGAITSSTSTISAAPGSRRATTRAPRTTCGQATSAAAPAQFPHRATENQGPSSKRPRDRG